MIKLDKKQHVSIFTLNGYTNYGNRLQLFALATILSSYNFELSVYWPKSLKTKVKELIRYSFLFRNKYLKEIKFRDFTNRYIPPIDNSVDYDIAVIGSDQVWNPDFLKCDPYLLDVPGNGKKISYAASVGTTEFDENEKRMFSDKLEDFIYISVREQSAKKMLQSLTDKEVKVVLDPTLLIEAGLYKDFERRPRGVDKGEKFILCYLLGDKKYKTTIKKFAEGNKYRVIYFSDKSDSEYGIEEFIYLVHHAELVCTDSFHACVFSFIFERPFVVFKRVGELNYMYTRIENFLDTFNLRDHEFDGRSITGANIQVDYSKAKKILKSERARSMHYLERALKVL